MRNESPPLVNYEWMKSRVFLGYAEENGTFYSEFTMDHKAHEEQPPAAARARKLPLRTPRRGCGKIKMDIRLRIGISNSLRQPPPRLRHKTASGDSGSAYPAVLTSLGFIVRLRRF